MRSTNLSKTILLSTLASESKNPDNSVPRSTVQPFTSSWVDVGSGDDAFIDVSPHDTIVLWIDATSNDSVNLRFRALAFESKSQTVGKPLPIQTVSASDVKVEAEYFEFNTDSFSSTNPPSLLEVGTSNAVPFIKIQIQAGTVGANAATLDRLVITKTKKYGGV